ncbi:MAG: hypothetical protein ACFFDN_31665 [Candidatus Hodarchaeota archaeon]
MAKRKSSLPDLKGLVVEAVKEGSRQEQEFIDVTPFWFRFFYYIKDPLEGFSAEKYDPKIAMKLFVNRQAEIKLISKYFGQAKNIEFSLHIAIIGSRGSGKKTTFKMISQIISESFPDISYAFYDIEKTYDYKENKQLSEKKLNILDDKRFDVRIISCTGKNKWLFLKRLPDFKKNTKVTFSIWNTRYYSIGDQMHVNKEIYFNNYNRDDITEIFKRRVNTFLDVNQDIQEYKENVYNKLLPKIASSFQGNLHICFQCFKDIHQQARVSNLKYLPEELINQIINKYLKIKTQKITSKEQEIIQMYLTLKHKTVITTTDLKEELLIDRTVAWRYLENLTKKHIFKKIKYGNPSTYQINEIFLSFYEDELKRQLIFKEE